MEETGAEVQQPHPSVDTEKGGCSLSLMQGGLPRAFDAEIQGPGQRLSLQPHVTGGTVMPQIVDFFKQGKCFAPLCPLSLGLLEEGRK